MNRLLSIFAIITCGYFVSIMNSGCAQIGMPTGGNRDSVAPVLVKANPPELSNNVLANKITLTFDEYIEVDNAQQNVLVTPTLKYSPVINYNLKSVTVKLKDTLAPNTTYAINFGNSIKDVNEGNIYKEYTYVFSTGDKIDSLHFSGQVLLAENGKADSTMMALLYRDPTDSSVRTRKPDYMARVNSEGRFNFRYLPAGRFKVYALRDGNGSKNYDSKTEMFAFRENDQDIVIADSVAPVMLYAFEEEKQQPPPVPGATAASAKPKLEKKLKYTAQPGKQELLQPLLISFNNAVKIDEQKIYLTDTNYKKIANVKLSIDSTDKIVSLETKWQPETDYILLIEKDAAKDSLENSIAKTDTIKFITKRLEDYGKVALRFSGLDLSQKPVLQFLEGETIKFTYALKSAEWKDDLFPPGEYGIRILYDTNGNLQWDPGNFLKNRQPEKTVTMPQKLGVRANWENEREIKLD